MRGVERKRARRRKFNTKSRQTNTRMSTLLPSEIHSILSPRGRLLFSVYFSYNSGTNLLVSHRVLRNSSEHLKDYRTKFPEIHCNALDNLKLFVRIHSFLLPPHH